MLAHFAENLITTVFVLFGGITVAVLVLHYRKRRWLRSHGVRVPGRIVRLELNPQDCESTALFPVVEFQPLGSQMVEVRYSVGHYPSAYQIGQQVMVCYDPATPERFDLNVDAPDYSLY